MHQIFSDQHNSVVRKVGYIALHIKHILPECQNVHIQNGTGGMEVTGPGKQCQLGDFSTLCQVVHVSFLFLFVSFSP